MDKVQSPWSKNQLAKANVKLMSRNSDYENTLKSIVKLGTFGTDMETGEIIRNEQAIMAYEVLNKYKKN